MKPIRLRKLFPSPLTWAHRIKALLWVAPLGLLAFTHVPAAQAAAFSVQMTSLLAFSPNYLEIQVGDEVTWVNQDPSDFHDSVSSGGYWDSRQLDFGGTYTLMFPVPGTFPYADSFYGPAGMTGTIVVKPSTSPPRPVLTNPTLLPDHTFRFTVTNLVVGKTNIIQASLSLTVWTNIATNVATNNSYTFVDQTAAAFGRRNYRAVVLP